MNMKNKQGQVVFYTFMVGLVIILVGLAVTPIIKEIVTDSSSSMDCDNETISNFQKVGCIANDINMPLTIGFIIFIGGGVILAKVVF